MSRHRYTKFIPQPIDGLDLGDLMDRLKEFFLQSGFQGRMMPGQAATASLDSLLRALAEILSDNLNLPQKWRRQLAEFSEQFPEGELDPEVKDFLGQLIQKLMDEGFLRQEQAAAQASPQSMGQITQQSGEVRFELTEKAADFLGYRTLRELLGALGRGAFGRHDTELLNTGVASDCASRPYEFGDTLNLDINKTLLNSIRRTGKVGLPLNLEYGDLEVYQTEQQSSCATVLMLDCSHSMILYGEDRFTPAKKVALALAHLIRTQFPGDSLEIVLFHDSAEQIPLAKLASVQVGPYHTNTCEGLRLAQRLLRHQSKDMRQIIMITDGKPSAMTLPGNRIYKNPFGLDPMILKATFQEVANCRKAGILINTFMVAQDYYLVEFVRKVSQICRGKAYFTATLNLASSVLMDFMSRKTRRVH